MATFRAIGTDSRPVAAIALDAESALGTRGNPVVLAQVLDTFTGEAWATMALSPDEAHRFAAAIIAAADAAIALAPKEVR